MYGQVVTGETCPTVAGSWALAEEAAMNCAATKQPSANDRTFNQSEENDLSGR